MIQIAIIEDDDAHLDRLKEHLLRYEQEQHCPMQLKTFSNAVSFLENYRPVYDVVFMDIGLQYVSGMTAARELRKLDQSVILIFVTSLAQYALEGYEVNAADYILKPVAYYDFALKLKRAMDRLVRSSSHELLLSFQNGMVRISVGDIYYVETAGHNVLYHTKSGSFAQRRSLTSVERELREFGFYRCNSCYLVNLEYVRGISGYTATVNNTLLQISQPRKEAFCRALRDHMGG